jgi:hypothetical protein
MSMVVVIGKIDYPALVSARRFAHPNPKQLILFSDGVATHARAVGNTALPRYRDANAAAVEGEAVIATLDATRDDLT